MSLPHPITVECSFTYGPLGIDLEASASSSSSLKGSCDSASSSTMCSSKQTDSASLIVDVEYQKNNDDAAMIDILWHLLDNDIDNNCTNRQPPPPPPPPDSSGVTGDNFAVPTIPASNSHQLDFFSWDELWEPNPGCSVAPECDLLETMNEWEIDGWMLDTEMDFGGSSGTLEIQDP